MIWIRNGTVWNIVFLIESGYPSEKSFKLYERKAECHDAIFNEECLKPQPNFDDGQFSITAYKEAIKLVSKSNLSKEKINAFIKTTKEKIEAINRKIDRAVGAEKYAIKLNP